MQSTPRLHSQAEHCESGDVRSALADLRRKAWETLLDLGLTEEEIAAYYGIARDGSMPARDAGRQAALRQGIPVR